MRAMAARIPESVNDGGGTRRIAESPASSSCGRMGNEQRCDGEEAIQGRGRLGRERAGCAGFDLLQGALMVDQQAVQV